MNNPFNEFNEDAIQSEFLLYCENNNIEQLKVFLEYVTLLVQNKEKENIDLPFLNGLKEWGFINSCNSCAEDTFNYLFQNIETTFTDHQRIKEIKNEALNTACQVGSLPIVKKLMTHSSIGVFPNIHNGSDTSFYNAFELNHHDIIHFLIFECNLDINLYISRCIVDSPDIQAMFKERDILVLKDNLDTKLNNKVTSNSSRLKI